METSVHTETHGEYRIDGPYWKNELGCDVVQIAYGDGQLCLIQVATGDHGGMHALEKARRIVRGLRIA